MSSPLALSLAHPPMAERLTSSRHASSSGASPVHKAFSPPSRSPQLQLHTGARHSRRSSIAASLDSQFAAAGSTPPAKERGAVPDAAPQEPLLAQGAAEQAVPNAMFGWLQNFYERYELSEVLGRGTFGTVSVAIDRRSGRRYAVKVLTKARKTITATPEHYRERIRGEVGLLRAAQARREVLQLKGAYEDEDSVYIVTELCTGGSLADVLRAITHFTERDAAHAIRNMANALAECHRLGICYGDVKPENFLLKRPLTCTVPASGEDSPRSAEEVPLDVDVRMVDFGCSQRVGAGGRLTKASGTPQYVAPEVFMRSFGVESDVWSAGMVLYKMLCGSLPFWNGLDASQLSPKAIMGAILMQDVAFDAAPWQGISPEARDLVERMLDRNYEARISAKGVLSHPWVVHHCGPCSEEECPVEVPPVSNVVIMKRGDKAAPPSEGAVGGIVFH